MVELLSFLEDIKENNNKEWFTANKKRHDFAKKQLEDFAKNLSVLMQKHDNIDPKPKVFRIYRDVRFSTDKTPYKTNFAGSFSRQTAALRGGYYFHIEPNNTFVGGGFWDPSKEDLQLLRLQIQQDAEPLRAVINAKDFKNYFGQLEGDQLKTSPKGFDNDEPNIDLLRHKNFLVMHKFTNQQILQNDFAEQVNDGFKKMRGFFDVMSEYLTTNLNGESVL